MNLKKTHPIHNDTSLKWQATKVTKFMDDVKIRAPSN
jgi:hypothetical protein